MANTTIKVMHCFHVTTSTSCTLGLYFQGKKHIEWFSENFEQVLDAGAKELAAVNEMAKQCDQYLKLQDSFTVSIEEQANDGQSDK